MEIPETLGAVADKLWETRAARLALQKQVDELENFEKALRAHIIETLPKSDASGVSGKLATVRVVTREEPTVVDWDSFYKYVKKNSAFDLLTKKLSAAAVKERWADSKEVPGVGKFNVVTISLGKAK